MANTFKVKTKLNTGISSGISTIYTAPSSTTAVLVGLTLANTSSNLEVDGRFWLSLFVFGLEKKKGSGFPEPFK